MSPQANHSLDHFSRKRSLTELLHSQDDDSGYVEGKVFMTWPPRNRQHRINLEVAEGSNLYRFEVEVPHGEGIAFRPHERVCVALIGMKVVPRGESSAPHNFPITLRFPNGVILKYLSGINAGKVVDTWEGNADEWYNPSTAHTVSDATDTSENRRGAAPTATYSSIPIILPTDPSSCHNQVVDANQPSLSSVPLLDGTRTAQSICPAPSTERPGRSSRARLRKKRRLLKEKEPVSAKQITINEPAELAISLQEQIKTSFDASTGVSSNNTRDYGANNGHINRRTPTPDGNRTDIPHGNSMAITSGEASTFDPQLKAGIRTQRGDIFSSLSEIQKGPSLINVIGIVRHVSPERKTSTNEWCRSIALVDPSTVDLPRQSIKVNCFQKKYPEWLPQVQMDDIVILRKLKVVEFHGVLIATGYGDKLRWAVYDPLKHSIRPPKKGSAPEKELVDDGMGYEYSPYWEPSQDSVEIEYCRRLGEWWKAICALGGDKVPTVECSASKQHLLISEASPDLPPKGFFNCTIEVLRTFTNDHDPAVIYVTDYTVNSSVQPVRSSWCPPQLAGRVMKCSMWDSAGSIAKMMNPGEYWFLHNIRAKWNPNHYMECTMQQAEKVTQLDETRLEARPHLRALLARKKEFELNHPGPTTGSAPVHLFPEILIQDVEENTSFLTCIVELLHIDPNSCDGHILYVTDYTYNPDLPTTVSTAVWAHNLEHRVVKIKLDDAQAKSSSDLAPGNAYMIRNMRIRRSGGIHGCLGGDDTLIDLCHDSSSQQVQRLRRNKEKWERENVLNAPVAVSDQSFGETGAPLKQSSALLNNSILEGNFAGPAPVGFKVLARAVDFFPFSLEDACVLVCTNCKARLSPSRKRCLDCDDMLETRCKWLYCLCILLQDERGNEFVVSLSEKECPLFHDVAPTDFRYDQAAYHQFLEKLDPILGNLRDVHLAWSRDEDLAIKSPQMIFSLESWKVGDEKIYGLLNYFSS